MKFRSRILSGLVSLAVIGTLGVASAPAAQARASCGKVYSNGYDLTVSCQGSGQFRVTVTCYPAYVWETRWSQNSGWRGPVSLYWNHRDCPPAAGIGRVVASVETR